jgi:two-component system nitrogen regulation response regulator GlnG
VEDGEGDLVITDVVMPDENGLDLIPRIKRIRPELRGDRDERAIDADDRGEGGAARRVRISAEAVRPAELLAVVDRALAAPAAERDLTPGGTARRRGTPAADRPQPGDAGDLPHHRPADDGRPDGDDQRRIGTGKELVARALHDYGRAAPGRSWPSTWRRSRAS